MQKQVRPSQSVFITWKHRLPFWLRRSIARRWNRRGMRLAEKASRLLQRAGAFGEASDAIMAKETTETETEGH